MNCWVWMVSIFSHAFSFVSISSHGAHSESPLELGCQVTCQYRVTSHVKPTRLVTQSHSAIAALCCHQVVCSVGIWMSCKPAQCMWFLIVLCLIVLCRINSWDSNKVHCIFATSFPPFLCCSFSAQQVKYLLLYIPIYHAVEIRKVHGRHEVC